MQIQDLGSKSSWLIVYVFNPNIGLALHVVKHNLSYLTLWVWLLKCVLYVVLRRRASRNRKSPYGKLVGVYTLPKLVSEQILLFSYWKFYDLLYLYCFPYEVNNEEMKVFIEIDFIKWHVMDQCLYICAMLACGFVYGGPPRGNAWVTAVTTFK